MDYTFRLYILCVSMYTGGLKVAGSTTIDQNSLQFPESLPGTNVVIEKQFDPKTGVIKFVSKSSIVNNAGDLIKLEEMEKNIAFSKHGALTRQLRNQFYQMRDTDLVDVMIYLSTPQPKFLDPRNHTEFELRENERSIESLMPFTSATSEIAKFSGSLRNAEVLDSGKFKCKVSKNQLNQLRFNKFIDNITLLPMTPNTAYAFSSLTSSSYNPSTSMPPTSKGQNINVATFESGLANNTTGSDGLYYPFGNFVGCLANLYLPYIERRQPPWSGWTHSQQTFKCLWQTAPYANFFHRASIDYTTTGSESFISSNAIQSVSMSVAPSQWYICPNGNQPTIWPIEDANGVAMERMDEWAYRMPYPVFCNPAANWGSNYEVNWQCYNAISVGNVRHTNLNHYEIDNDVQADICTTNGPCTQTRNPPSLYGGPGIRAPLNDANGQAVYSGWSGDREMPNIVTPGFTPSPGIAMVDDKPCLEAPLWCGTSYSAPITNGIVACVLSSDTRMRNRPEVVRAVLLATAQNVDGGEWDRYIDGRDGAGVVSGSSAVYFAQNHSEPGPSSTAQQYGIGSGTITPSTANGSSFTYNIIVPSPKPAGKHLRIVLTWSSNPVRSPTWNYLSDLDISWDPHNGFPQRYSSSYNNNVEIVDVPSSEVSSGSVYQTVISLYANRVPLGQFSKYVVAWNWVKDHAQ